MFPRLFQVGDFTIPTYGVLFTIGIILGTWVSERNFERLGINPQKARNLGLLVVVSGIAGAKLLTIVNSWEFYSAHPRELFSLAVLQAGGVFLGGLVAALVAGTWYVHRNGMPGFASADAFAPGVALGHAIGRVGCFAAGCCWGKPTEVFWGVTFKDHVAEQWAGTPLGVALIPTQLLEVAFEFANFLLLMKLFRHQRFQGQTMGAYLFVYGFGRYWMEYLRGDPGRGSVFGGAISGTQLISIALVIAGTMLWLRRAQNFQGLSHSNRLLANENRS